MKTKMKLFLGIFFILICILSIKAQPVVSNVILNPVNNVELFGTIEISFDVSGTFSNVYDSSSVYVNGRFFSPIADQTTKSSTYNLMFQPFIRNFLLNTIVLVRVVLLIQKFMWR